MNLDRNSIVRFEEGGEYETTDGKWALVDWIRVPLISFVTRDGRFCTKIGEYSRTEAAFLGDTGVMVVANGIG